MNTLDRRVCLPVIDGHCHVFGLSMTKGEELHPRAEADKVVFVQAGANKTWATEAPVYLWNSEKPIQDSQRLGALSVVELSQHLFDTARETQVGRKVTVRSGEFKILDSPRSLDYWRPLLTGGSGLLLRLAKRVHGFGKYANGNDGKNARLVLEGVPNVGRGKATVPLHMDLACLPLEMGNMAEKSLPSVGTTKSGTAVEKGAAGYYIADPTATAELNRWLWYARSHYMWTVYELADVCKRFPGQMWPFIHFDPRRARDDRMNGEQDGLKTVKKAIAELGFVGVKTYTRLGWVPWGNTEFYGETVGGELDRELTAMYKHCINEDLPVMSHMSPSGFPPSGEPKGWTRPNNMLVYPRAFHEVNWAKGFTPETPPQSPAWGLAPQTPSQSSLPAVWTARSIAPASWEAARRGMEIAFNYGHYLQTAVSPYAWEKVLIKWPTLRLCLAHAGTAATLLAKYYDKLSPNLPKVLRPNGTRDHVRLPDEEHLESEEYNFMLFHCCVAGGKEYVDRWFPEFAARCAAAAHFGKRFSPAEKDGLLSAVRAILQTAEWDKRMARWKSEYPHDWLTKTIELMGKHKNVYTDISCLCAGSSKAVFKCFFQALVDDMNSDGPAKILRDRLIFGTDWYMTENGGVSAGEFWDRVMSVVPASTYLFYRCSTLNTLRYLNLSPQKPGKEGGPMPQCRMESMERRYAGHDLPDWWEDVKRWYKAEAGT